MMRWFRWWAEHRRAHQRAQPFPPADPDEEAVTREKESLQRDLTQVQRLDEYLLNRAVDTGLVTPERAAAIRLTHATERDDIIDTLEARVRMRTRYDG